MTQEELLQEVLPYLVAYVQEGKLNVTPYLREQLQLDRLADLLKLAILQRRETQQFMQYFTKARHFHTAPTTQIKTYVGEVRGHILWQQTLQKQQTHTKQHIVSEQTRKGTHDVMVQIVQFVAATVNAWCQQKTIASLFQTRSWAAALADVLPAFREAAKHVPLKQVQPDRRMLTQMRQHRLPLYRLAATLYAHIVALHNRRYEAPMLQQALHAFLIVPQQRETLFELYWAVQIVKQQTNVTFFLQDGVTRPLAAWQQGETTVTLYHNKTGSSRVSFHTKLEELTDTHPFMQATKQTAQQFNIAAEALFERKPSTFIWRGRPDLLLEYVKDGVLTDVVIGEVKYTASEAYMQQGLKQLLHYMYFMKAQHAPRVHGFLAVYDYPPSKIDTIQLLSVREQTMIQLPKLEE